jgi:chitodextrinase
MTPAGTISHQITGLGTTIFTDEYSYLVPSGGDGYYAMRTWNANGSNTPSRYDFDVTITPQADTSCPSTIMNLTATPISSTEIDLSWTPSTDDVGPVGYGIGDLNANTFFGISKTAAFRVRNLAPNTTYLFGVGAVDAGGNISGGAAVTAATLSQPQGDTTPPTTPTNLSWTDITTSSVTLAWNASTDNVGVVGYHIYNSSNAALIATTSNTSYPVTGLTAGGTYSFYVRAYDAAGNQSAASNLCGVTLPNNVAIVPVSSGNNIQTPVTVTLPSGGTATVTVQFPQITSGGNLRIVAVNTPPASPPYGFAFLSTIYYVSTTASYTPPVIVTFPYDPSQVVGSESNLRLFHWENGAWRDVTVSVDTVNKTITGQVDSISPFGIGYPLGSGGGYSTGVNENMIALIAILTIFTGVFLIRRIRPVKIT